MQDNTYTNIPNTLIAEIASKAKPSAFVVYVLLRTYRNNKSGKAWPGRETIAETAGISEATVTRSLRELQALGYIEIKRRFGESSVVAFNDVQITSALSAPVQQRTDEPSNSSPVSSRTDHPCATTITNTITKTTTKEREDETTMSSEIENDARRKALAHMWRWYTENVRQHQEREPDPKEYDEKFIDGIIAANVSTDYAHRCKVAPYLIDIAFFEVVWPFTIERPSLRSIHTHRARLVDAYWEHRDERWPVLFTPEERETK